MRCCTVKKPPKKPKKQLTNRMYKIHTKTIEGLVPSNVLGRGFRTPKLHKEGGGGWIVVIKHEC